jgi:hypothetical protein
MRLSGSTSTLPPIRRHRRDCDALPEDRRDDPTRPSRLLLMSVVATTMFQGRPAGLAASVSAAARSASSYDEYRVASVGFGVFVNAWSRAASAASQASALLSAVKSSRA